MKPAEMVLQHHGVRGMKWGVRRTKAQLAADSQDAAAANATKDKIKANKGKTNSLSNSELQTLITRMNLEQQYSRLVQDHNHISRGQKTVKDLLGVGKTLQEVNSFLNGPLAKDLRKLFGK